MVKNNENEEMEKDELLFEEEDDLEVVKKKSDSYDDNDEDDVDVDEEDYHELSTEDKIENIEKKINIIIVLIAITLLFCIVNTIVTISEGTGNRASNGEGAQQQETVSYDISDFKKITAADIESESKDETIVVWIGRQGCGYCKQYAPIIAQAGEDFGIKVRYLDLLDIFSIGDDGYFYIQDQQAYTTLKALTGKGDWATFVEENLGGTPLTIIIKNNKVVGGLSQAESIENVEKAFEDAGLKK